ncbi:exonuclease domain-containing protein [Liberiplasma polymorphum]|uniref:exonuclease domain-containing protein n=1 Tax=Liberiplasma polymorphum TaxID=3374570 RepID=UPI003774283F
MQIQTHGKILAIDEENRIIVIQTRKDQKYVYFQRAMFARYMKYFNFNNRISLTVKIRQPNKKIHKYTAVDIIKISTQTSRMVYTLYSQEVLSKDTQKFINSLKNKMFLDLEMAMHPYKVDKDFIQEIIQVGYVLTNENDEVIEKYMCFVKPTLHPTLTKRTLKFLDLKQEDVDQGVSFNVFYNHFKKIIKHHQPAIIVWGKNDHLALKDAYEINKVESLHKHTRFVNLLQLHKNVYSLKNDLGLANAYKLYGYTIDSQRHDALEDAMMTRKIFNGFKAVLNGTESVEIKPLKE